MLNQIQIIGHLGRDPEVRQLPTGEPVANLAVATTEKWKDKNTGEAKQATEWHRVSMFGKLAEISGQYLHKGSLIYISGKLKTRKYTDKDGVEKYATEIQASEMKMLGGKPDGQQGQQPARQAAPQRQAPQPVRQGQSGGFAAMDDDIPFANPMRGSARCLAM